MTDKFSLKEVCGEYVFYEEGDSFPLTEKQILNKLNENEQLKKENRELEDELHEFKEYVFSDEKILCYSCVNCVSKGIYEVDCYVKGKVDVHGLCFSYWKNEVKK